MNLELHDSANKDLSETKKAFLEQWVLGVTCDVTDIKDTYLNNFYKCPSDYVTLSPKIKMEDQYFMLF